MPERRCLAMVQTGAAQARAARPADARDRRRRRAAARRGVRHLRQRLRAVRGRAAHADARDPRPRAARHRSRRSATRRRGAGASTSATASRSRRCSRAASAARASAAATTCAAAPHLLLHPARRAAGPVGRLRRVHVPRAATRSCTRSTGARRPSMAVMFNPLGAGFRWAVEMPSTGPATPCVILGPGQRGLASVIACREAGAGTDHRHRPRRRRAQARARARVRRRPHDRRRERGRERARARAHGRTRRRRRRRRLRRTRPRRSPQALDYVRAGRHASCSRA